MQSVCHEEILPIFLPWHQFGMSYFSSRQTPMPWRSMTCRIDAMEGSLIKLLREEETRGIETVEWLRWIVVHGWLPVA
jgi:hypothetical protein